MSRTNLDPLMTFPDGSHLVVSTQCSKEGDFSCALYSAVVAKDDGAAFMLMSSHLGADTCLAAQQHAYDCAVRLFPRVADTLKKPPYLIWAGPRSSIAQ
jgi:hypothetical protein